MSSLHLLIMSDYSLTSTTTGLRSVRQLNLNYVSSLNLHEALQLCIPDTSSGLQSSQNPDKC